jgi:4-hydroxy-2-oxoheptanedioate aldolase
MRDNWVKRRLQEGGTALGTFLSIDSTFSAELLAHTGFDWLLVDMEHGPFDLIAAGQMMQAIRTTPTIPLARVGWNDLILIQQTLDLGAYGLVVPMVNSAREAADVVYAARYPPVGERSRGGTRAQLAFDTDAITYGRQADDEMLLLVQIETLQAVEAAEEILSVPGVDGFFLGPNDLSTSMHVWPPKLHDPEPAFAAAIDRTLQAALRLGKIPGIMVPDVAMANRYIAQGFTFVSLGSDARILEAAARSHLAAITRTGTAARS